jgi:hypothetical protein
MRGKWNVSPGIKLLAVVWLVIVFTAIFDYVYGDSTGITITMVLLILSLFVAGALLVFIKRMSTHRWWVK